MLILSFFLSVPAISDEGKVLSVAVWGYQLQNIRPAAIVRSAFDLMVIDYSTDGSDASAFSTAELAYMQGRPNGGKRKLISYLSIGEAERYRGYWDSAWESAPPDWLGEENSDWPGNFLVKYWDPNWKKILLGSVNAYLDRILTAGFDGVYLDKIDSFENFANTYPSAEEKMVALVTQIAAYARARHPGFLVIAQNGEALLADPAYLAVIDGIAKEDLFYGFDAPQEPTPAEETAYSTHYLDLAVKAGKLVLTVDYVDDRDKIHHARTLSRERGYIPLTANRDLNKLPVR